jgi:hypothetical protein
LQSSRSGCAWAVSNYLLRARSERVRSDAFSTRYKISSIRPNAGLWKVRQGRNEGRSRSVAVKVTPLTGRCRARVRLDDSLTRLNVASDRQNGGTWVSNTVANADTGSGGRSVSEAGKRSESVPAGLVSLGWRDVTRTARPTKDYCSLIPGNHPLLARNAFGSVISMISRRAPRLSLSCW